MDLLFKTEATTTTAATPTPRQYASLLGDGYAVPYQNGHGVASLLARDLTLALFFMMTNFKGRKTIGRALFQCDFEDGWCPGFEVTKSSDAPWNLWKGETPSNNTGPSVDHTRFNKDGTYVYMEASNQRLGDTAVFKTPPVMLDEHPFYCLRFWYHMRGTTTGSLWVYWNAPVLHRSLDKHTGQESKDGEEWLQSKVTIISTQKDKFIRPVVFEFRAVRGTGYTGDIAIDDIVLVPEKCKEQIFSKTATTMTFRGITTTKPPDTTTEQPWQERNPRFGKCGKSYFNYEKQICCDDTVQRKSSHHTRCCGNQAMHAIYDKCCNGYKMSVMSSSPVACCNGRIPYAKAIRGCCPGSGAFDLRWEMCKNGKILKRKKPADVEMARLGIRKRPKSKKGKPGKGKKTGKGSGR